MEGSKTEPVVYNSWINYVAPHMSQVKTFRHKRK